MTNLSYSRTARTDYPDSTAVPHDTSDHRHDFVGHHLPQMRLHHLALHDWGIARGLEVSASDTTLTVEPGVAVDQQGQLIVLASGGYGDTGGNPLAGQYNPLKAPVRLLTSNMGGDTVYVIIRFSEIPQSVLPAPDTGPAERLEQAPWLRLRTRAELVGDEAAGVPFLVLAIADIDQNDRVVALRERDDNDPAEQHRRRLLGERVARLAFDRAAVEGMTVKTLAGAEIALGAGDELRITAPQTTVGGALTVTGILQGNLAADLVNTDQLRDGAVSAAKLQAGAVGAAALANDAVTGAKVANNAVATAKLQDSSVTTTKLADGAITASKVQVGSIDDRALANGAVTTLKVADRAITTTKLANEAVTSAHLQNGAITETALANNAVTTPKIQDSAINSAKLADRAVTAAKLQDGSVVDGKLADGAVSAAKLADNAVQTTKIQDKSISTNKLADAAVTLAKLADSAVTGVKLADGAVDTVKLADKAVTAAKLQDGSVGSAELADGAVNENKLAQSVQSTLSGLLQGLADLQARVAKLEEPAPTDPIADAPTAPGQDIITLPRDDQMTLKFRDDGTTDPQTDQFTIKDQDDPLTDPQVDTFTNKNSDDFTTIKNFDDGNTVKKLEDMVINRSPEPHQASNLAAAPFALATPHHTMAWLASHPALRQSELAALAQQLVQHTLLIRALEQQGATQALSEAQTQQLAALQQSYADLLAEYETLMKGDPS
ncbi:MAG: hypothetical protein DYG89_49005 [Caldilinea sp. CFX5]|nr:hypothetical protein [Caldilinea sp. CFX5]